MKREKKVLVLFWLFILSMFLYLPISHIFLVSSEPTDTPNLYLRAVWLSDQVLLDSIRFATTGVFNEKRDLAKGKTTAWHIIYNGFIIKIQLLLRASGYSYSQIDRYSLIRTPNRKVRHLRLQQECLKLPMGENSWLELTVWACCRGSVLMLQKTSDECLGCHRQGSCSLSSC